MTEIQRLRLIIPLVFYHGKDKWELPGTFAGQFNVDDDVKRYLPDFRYVLFDTRDWSFTGEANAELKENVFLMTALALMKSAFNRDKESVSEIFRFWHDKGFTDNREMLLFFLFYISKTKDMKPDQLKKLLEENKIDGGDIMPTLAQRIINEEKDKLLQAGAKEEKRKTVRRMMSDNVPIDNIAKYTGLKKEDIKKLIR